MIVKTFVKPMVRPQHYWRYSRVPSNRAAMVSRNVFWGASSPFRATILTSPSPLVTSVRFHLMVFTSVTDFKSFISFFLQCQMGTGLLIASL